MKSEDDMFDKITLAEDRFHSQGYSEGLALGSETGHRDGFATGVDQGSKIGSEVGFYRGFISSTKQILMSQNKHKQKVKHVTALEELLEAFDEEKVHDPQFMEHLDKIRAKFKQVCAVLGVNPQFGKPQGHSF